MQAAVSADAQSEAPATAPLESSDQDNYEPFRDVMALEMRLKKWATTAVGQQLTLYLHDPGAFNPRRTLPPLLTALFNRNPNNKKKPLVFLAGVHKGGSIQTLLSVKPEARVMGFEIQMGAYAFASKRFSKSSNVELYHVGASHKESRRRIATDHTDQSEGAGLHPSRGCHQVVNCRESPYTVATEPLSAFYDRRQGQGSLSIKNFDPVDFLLVDTEGHEPQVVAGLRLHEEKYRRVFPLFQFDLGAAWTDERHDRRFPSAFALCVWLEQVGYNLYLVRTNGLMPLAPEFFRLFDLTTVPDKSNFVRGTVLAVYYKLPVLSPYMDLSIDNYVRIPSSCGLFP